MKKTALILTSFGFFTLQSQAQGFLEFANWTADFTTINAPAYVNTVPSGPHPNTGSGVLAPTTAVAHLWWGVAGSTTWGQLTASGISAPLSSFAPNGGYFSGGAVGITGTSAGQNIVVGVRVFDSGSNSEGFSNLINVNNLAANTGPSFPQLVGLQPFAITVVPEPSTIALGLIGGAALLLRRRRHS